ncbi:MAG: CPBP family intramembrane metalloprotease [Sulfuriflexus sp.]|nr:CPBP family intramembrane metalloprotease [Sulfuriflexus sp.]
MNDVYSNHITRVSMVIAPFFLFGMINGVYNGALAQISPWLFWIVDVLGWIVLPSVILFYIYRYYGIGLADYGLKKFASASQRREIINWSFLATFILSIYYFSFGWLAREFVGVSSSLFSYAGMVPEGNAHYFAIFYLAITAAVFEEVFFRGLIWRLVYSSTTPYNKAIVYVAVSSVLFGLVHWENGLAEVFSAMVFGLVACVLYLRLHNLIPLIVAHFFIDIVNFW